MLDHFPLTRRRLAADRRPGFEAHGPADNSHRFFGGGGGSADTSSESSTSSNVEDSRTVSGDGGISAGAGASVSITTADASVLKEAMQANERVTGDALAAIDGAATKAGASVERVAGDAIAGSAATAKEAMQANERVTGDALAAVDSTTRSAFSFGGKALDVAGDTFKDSLAFVEKAQTSANEIIAHNNTAYAENLARNAGDAASTVAADANKQLMLVGSLALATVAAVVLFRK